MRPQYHAIASAGFGLAVYASLNSLGAALACLITGVFVDLDHLIDYYNHFGIELNLKKFYRNCYGPRQKLDKIYLVLHGYEYLIPLTLLIFLVDSKKIVIGAAVGFLQHMVLDQFGNKVKPFAYFITYRWAKGFSKSSLFRDSS